MRILSRHQVLSLPCTVLLSCAVLFTTNIACDDDDAESQLEVCKQTCQKFLECNLGSVNLDCDAVCTQQMSGGQGGGERCRNESAIIAKAKECLSVACSQLEMCIDTIPDCQPIGGSGGSGGSIGSGGRSGSGGSSGSGDCSICERAEPCCRALYSSGMGGMSQRESCDLTESCRQAGAGMSLVVFVCETILAMGSMYPQLAASCR